MFCTKDIFVKMYNKFESNQGETSFALDFLLYNTKTYISSALVTERRARSLALNRSALKYEFSTILLVENSLYLFSVMSEM